MPDDARPRDEQQKRRELHAVLNVAFALRTSGDYAAQLCEDYIDAEILRLTAEDRPPPPVGS